MKLRLMCFCVVLVLISCTSPRSDILSGRIAVLGDSITQDGRYVSILEYELFRHYPDSDVDLISIGLSSETVSGLTEPGHSYPRPNLHDRLDRALAKLKPKTVFACYGMNDGIYHPQSEERFQAYKNGIHKLIDDVRAIGARLILLTPPIFDPQVIAEKVVGPDAPQFGYRSPYRGYNDVLSDYAKWLQSLNEPDVQVIDLNGPMLAYLQHQRQANAEFALSKDGVHPNFVGHALMAQQILKSLGVTVKDQDPREFAKELDASELYKLVQERRHMRSMAWLVDIGYNRPGNNQALPLDEAEEKAAEIKTRILKMIKD